MNMHHTLCLILALFGSPYVLAGEIIANASVSLSADDAKDVYTGEKQIAGSVTLVPVDNAAEQDSFTGSFLKMDTHKYQTLWTKKSFREGLNPPAVKADDTEVISFVKRTPGAIGYVKAAPAGVKVIGKY